MKTLTKVKLINWHTFSNEEFEIYKNALITGENGTGKSTILNVNLIKQQVILEIVH